MAKTKISKKDDAIALADIKNEIENVVKSNKKEEISRNNKKKNAKKSVKNIKKELKRINSDSDDDLIIKRRIVIKNKKISRSFCSWLFNNREL